MRPVYLDSLESGSITDIKTKKYSLASSTKENIVVNNISNASKKANSPKKKNKGRRR
jgi:hypothetical protein